MAKFRKSILTEDREYSSPDGKLSVDLAAKEHWAQNVSQFIERGFDIPVFWDHPEDPSLSQPVKRKTHRKRAKDQAGWLTGAKVVDGALDLEFDIPKKADAIQVEHNLTKVSPVIWDELIDGESQTHKNVIGAVDLVVHPVDSTQSPFEPASIACSLVRFSLDSDKPRIYRMAEDMDTPEVDDSPSDESVDDAAVSNDNGRIKKVIDALAGMSIVLSDDTNEENFLEHLEQALLTAAAHEGGDVGGDVSTDTSDLDQASPEFAALSLERKERAKERKFFEAKHREEVAKRFSLLVENGQATPAEKKTWLPKLQTIKLSLDDDGKHKPSNVEEFIESRESVPKGTFWDDAKRTRMSQLEVAKPPGGLLGSEVDDEEADQIADQVFSRAKPKLNALK